MTLSKFRTAFPAACLAALFLTGCAGKWVKRPEADIVKRLAVVSVYMDNDIVSDYGKKASGGGIEMISGLIDAAKGEEDENVKEDRRPRQAMVTLAAKTFHNVLGKLPGWKVVPYESVVRSKTYQANFNIETANRTLATVGRVARKFILRNYVTPPKMHVIERKYADDSGGRQQLAELAKDLKVDAVAIVHVALGYNDGWLSVGGITKASPRANAQVLMVTREGKLAVLTDDMKQDNFVEVEGEVWVANRQLRLDDKARKLYAQALNVKARNIYSRLREELTAAP